MAIILSWTKTRRTWEEKKSRVDSFPHLTQFNGAAPVQIFSGLGGGGEDGGRWAAVMWCDGTCSRVSEVSRPSRCPLRCVSSSPWTKRCSGLFILPPFHYGFPPSLHTLHSQLLARQALWCLAWRLKSRPNAHAKYLYGIHYCICI